MLPILGVIPAAGTASRLGTLGYAKELLPITYVTDPATGQARPLAVIEASLAQLRAASVERALVVISDRKPELLRYLGHGGDDLDIAFLHQTSPDGLAAAVALAAPWAKDCNICLLLPDTVVRPRDALKQLCAAFEHDGADLMLGVFPTAHARELGPVRFDAAMAVLEVQDKPQATDLANSWAMAVWGPRFTALLTKESADPSKSLGAIFHQAVMSGLKVRAVWFTDGQFHDVGTPRGLSEALPLLRGGL